MPKKPVLAEEHVGDTFHPLEGVIDMLPVAAKELMLAHMRIPAAGHHVDRGGDVRPRRRRLNAIWPGPFASVMKTCIPAGIIRLRARSSSRANGDLQRRMLPEQDVVLKVDRLTGGQFDRERRDEFAVEVIG